MLVAPVQVAEPDLIGLAAAVVVPADQVETEPRDLLVELAVLDVQ